MFILAFVSISAYAQSLTVTGKVIDSEGYEVIGGSVTVKGAAGVGTVTDVNGNYSLKVNDASKDVLVFSYVGMTSQEVKVNGKNVINVTLKADAVLLDEVVAIGYATVKRKDLTGSVASVNSKELSKVPTSDITQALAGRMAGVQVMQSEGAPGASISIRVRGGISITQSNEPLYIIDGFPSEDGMSTLDPAEIETIDILKDASATAIYGARGANGVVVITTKSGGKEGKATVTFDSYVGFKKIAKKLDVLSTAEFAMLDYERRVYDATTQEDWDKDITAFETLYGKYSDIGTNYSNRKGIDWQDETLGRTALTQNYRVGVSGGTDKLNYNLAYSYYDEEGAMVYSGNKKHNISFNMNHKLNDRLSVNARVSYDQMKVYGMGTSEGGDRFNKMQHILQYRPMIGIGGTDDLLLGDEDPIFVDDTGNVMQNPLLSAAEETNDREYRTFQANGGFTLKLFKGFSFRNTTGMRYQTRRNDIFYGDKSITAKRSSINGSIQNLENSSFQTSNVLNYTWSGKGHDVTAMVGQEYVNRWSRNFKAAAANFPNDDIGLGDLSLGLPTAVSSAENYDDKLLSFFTRVNYGFKDKYLFTASFRADGSSKFGKNNKYAFFPSAGLAWYISNEEFMKKLPVISTLKLHTSYGIMGNSEIGTYASLATIGQGTTVIGGETVTTAYLSKMANKDLKWEKTAQFDLGLNLGLFKDRLSFDVSFYHKYTSDLLYSRPLPYSTGFSDVTANIGEVSNKGVDLMVNAIPISNRDFSWSATLNLNYNKNKVEKLGANNETIWNNWGTLKVGESLSSFGGYEWLGIYDSGDQIGRSKIATEKSILGKGLPDWTGSFIHNLNYKNFDLTVDMQFVWGVEVLQDFLHSTQSRFLTSGLSTILTDAWTPTNTNTTVQMIYNRAYGDGYSDQNFNSSWIADGSYFRMNMIQLGYTFTPSAVRKIGVKNMRLYFSVNNAFMICSKDFKGYDPESSSKGSSTWGQNVLFFAYPKARTYTVGANITF